MTDSSFGSAWDPGKGPPSDNRLPSWLRKADDIATMVLVLRRKTNDDGAESDPTRKPDLSLPNTFVVGTTIEKAIGTKEARTIDATREGRGTRYILRTSSKNIYEKLLKLTELVDGTPIEIFRHPTLNTVQGTVYDPDSIDVDEKAIAEYLSSQGVHAVRRIKKRVNGNLQNTPLLVLSFHGTVLPKHVFFGVLRIPVTTYYPSPLICFNCGAYGHSRKSCQNCGICLRCSQAHSLPEGEKCDNSPHCIHCKSGHAITSRDCPKYKSEEKIIRIKVNQGISFTEARKIYAEESRRNTFANVAQEHLNQELAAKDKMIAALQNQVATLAKELASLKRAIKSRGLSQSPAPSQQKPSTQTCMSSQIASTYTSSSGTTKPLSPTANNTRLSRKDKSFVSPPNKKTNSNNTRYDIRTRSRSDKRRMEISPTDENNGGKRHSTQTGDRSSSKNLDE